MAIKVQVKDNRGVNGTFCNGSWNTNGQPAFGVMPMNTTFANADAFGFGSTPACEGTTFGDPTAQPFTAGNGQWFNHGPVAGNLTSAFNGGLPTNVVNRIATVDPAMGQLAARIAQIDPTFVASLSSVAGGCIWTAAKLVQVAGIDLPLARTIVNLALANPHEALKMAQIALTSPVEARRQMAMLGWNASAAFSQTLPTVGYADARNQLNGLGTMIPVDVYSDGLQYIIEADLPGRSIDDVDITAVNGRLIIEASGLCRSGRKADLPMIAREKSMPITLRRELAIGGDVDVTSISARIVNGVLSITLPKKALVNDTMVARESSLVC